MVEVNRPAREGVYKMKKMWFAVMISAGFISTSAFALRPVTAEIQINPASEFGVVYSSTGYIPAKLQLYCKTFTDEASWDGTLPGDPKPCGTIDLQVRMSSLGLTAFYFDEHQPLTIRIHANPVNLPLRNILGSYRGGKAGAGMSSGALTLVLRNDLSGLWATAGQLVNGMDIGIDLSMPTLEVYLAKPGDLTRTLDSFVQSI